MTTATCEPTVSKLTLQTQSETRPTDLEIWRRVARIRSNWSLTERAQRREEAESRFIDLMCSIGLEAA